MYKCEYEGPRGRSRLHVQPAFPDDHPSFSDSSPHGASSNSQLPCAPRVNASCATLSSDLDNYSTLDATELDLLSHYLTHTSQNIPFDDLDHYALSVGIPNIAFKSRPVMSSLVALAAACQCHDLVKSNTSLEEQTVIKIQELLMLAERHHTSSLQHIQVAMAQSDCYDNILANAALMVLYASASHSVRVHLATSAKRSGQKMPDQLLPQHSQWMSFTRAAHMASTAILDGIVESMTNIHAKIHTPSPTINTPALPNQHLTGNVALSPQDGPTGKTRRLFLPLVVSTYTQALEILRGKAKSTAALFELLEASTCNHLPLDACLKALSVLETCASDALSTKKTFERHNSPRFEPLELKHIKKVSPWVGEYMASVTSIKSPKALRRTIMSFLNKAPAEFLNIVQSMLDSSFAEAGIENMMSPNSPEPQTPLLNSTRLLIMDIFAHWLVLVMLLDGVWWIGGIGQWELGRVIALIKPQVSLHQPMDTRETWWPESMHCVKLELSPCL
ncbi:C6 transcription factor [Penicillium pulvis]|uniref:C6 transcription factor n=1 Tax=Penicillium pulvis TaxID=1562058 RepID=UPI0025470673|nr:C6 transcription factor [Penicillium pulvis]KAJ5785296.1 C6 transcription factor [Penicillium pulvis]